MSCCNTGLFNGVVDFESVDFISEININFKAFLDASFLNIGAFVNVDSGTEYCGKDVSILSEISLPTTKPYSIWAAPQKDWVWESIGYNSEFPNTPTIYLDGVDRTVDCEINYPLGQIKTEVDATTAIASYAFRKVQVYTPYNSGWWLKLVRHAFDSVKSTEELKGLLRPFVMQLPSISLETGATTTRPKQIGSSATIISQVIIINIVADTAFIRDKLTSIIVSQTYNSFNMFNSDRAEFPLNCDGSRNGSVEYTDIPEWKCLRMENSGSSIFESSCGNIFFSRIRMVFEIHSPKKPKIL